MKRSIVATIGLVILAGLCSGQGCSSPVVDSTDGLVGDSASSSAQTTPETTGIAEGIYMGILEDSATAYLNGVSVFTGAGSHLSWSIGFGPDGLPLNQENRTYAIGDVETSKIGGVSATITVTGVNLLSDGAILAYDISVSQAIDDTTYLFVGTGQDTFSVRTDGTLDYISGATLGNTTGTGVFTLHLTSTGVLTQDSVPAQADVFVIDLCPADPTKLLPGVCGCGVADTDLDGDTFADCVDACPLNPFKLLPGLCGCGALDSDIDSDLIVDCVDNCYGAYNPGQGDWNGDGYGDACSLPIDAYLLSSTGVFLGNVNNNAFDPDSLASAYGDYGSKYRSLSIWNSFGTYGSTISTLSPWNASTLTPPVLVAGGQAVAYVTVSTILSPAVHPNDLAVYVGRGDAVR
jgi:hypothetical protein